MTDHPDDRSSLAVAVAWASQVTTVALEMALPAVAGHWVDRWLHTDPLFLLLGALFGFTAGMWHLLRLTASKNLKPPRRGAGRDRPDSPRPDGPNKES
ncbi:MAG: AtpZ/AtpI family protein [Pirellulales bacterium]|nr:AtpZ/AtpI family protein [Pirellulales bacterium]